MKGVGERGYFCVPTINSVWIPVASVTESRIAGMVVMSKENVVRVKPQSGIQLVYNIRDNNRLIFTKLKFDKSQK